MQDLSEKIIKENVRLVWFAHTLNESYPGCNRRWFSIKFDKQLSRLAELGQSDDVTAQLLKALGVFYPKIVKEKIRIIKFPKGKEVK